jgi:tetratricopeptide (TPR) repeat protein
MTPAAVDPSVLINLARQDMALGQMGAAEAKCLQALSAHHHHPGALEVLGEVLHAQGRHEDAVRVFNALTLMQPTVAVHWQNLGAVLRATRRYEQALEAFERALQLAPVSSGLLYNLGVLQMDRCDYASAYNALRDAAGLAPRDATIRWAFAQCCYDMTRLEEAREILQDWQRLEGQTLDITVLTVLLLVMMAAVSPTEPVIQHLLANPPQQGRTALRFASILERLNFLNEARAILEHLERSDRSLEHDPERLLMAAVLADRAGEHERAYQQLSLALQYQKDLVHRHTLLYPLAKACDALGRYDEAYAVAQEAHVSQLAYLQVVMGMSAAEETQLWSLTANGCDARDVESWGTTGPETDASPIFIVGFPRSGTTLLEQVLDAHPRLESMDEQPFLLNAVTEVTDSGIGYPAELGKLSSQALDDIRARYWDRVRKRKPLAPGQRLVDKNPLNMLVLPLIRRLFPNARIVLAIRHPCDTLLSCYLQHFRAPGLALACRDLQTLGKAYGRVFDFWYSQASLLRPAVHELRYETLTADFEAAVRELAAFLGLPWDDAMLAPGKHARAKGFISTPSYAQVLAPVNSRSVGRWRHYEPHFGAVLAGLMPWIRRLGYPDR